MPKTETKRPPAASRLALQAPTDIVEALDSMESTLDYFHEHHDFRAVFLKAYFIITKNVHMAIQADSRHPIFLDPAWMSRLAGKFATLYFRSLDTFERSSSTELAWKMAHGLALQRRSSVIQDLLLGIFAHIKYDLAVAIFQNLREHSDFSEERLSIRKADHDQANTILKKSIEEIKRTIPHEYGGVLGVLRSLAFGADRDYAIRVVQHHREKVWSDALALLRAETDLEFEQVIEKLNRESAHFLERIAGNKSHLFKALFFCMRLTRRRRLRPRNGRAGST